MAVCDANYRFTYLDVGAYGSEGDINVFRNSKFGKDVINDRQDFPDEVNINGEKLPFFYIGDDAFPLLKRLVKPYGGRGGLTNEERVFNYRMSRARRCIENAFGIMSSKWLVLKKSMFCTPDRAQKIITACCLLHNYLLNDNRRSYCPPSFADTLDSSGNIVGEWRTRIGRDSLYYGSIPASSGRTSDYGKRLRDKIKEYVNSSQGSLPWQNRLAFVT